MLIRSLFDKYLVNAGRLTIAALLIGTALCHPAHAQITFLGATQLVDNVANQGSPTLTLLLDQQLLMYYVNHSNNTIYVDFELSGKPESTGIVVNSQELTDVGAAPIDPGTGGILISYVLPNQQLAFAYSSNGVNFGAPVTPSNASLGLIDTTPDWQHVPALASVGASGYPVYVATTGTNGLVYMSYTLDGVHFTPLTSGPVSTYTAVSRPSLTIYGYNGNPWVGFTTGSNRVAIVGDATTNDIGWDTGNVYWGNSNRNGNYAGIALVSSGRGCVGNACTLYVFGQDTASSQQLKSIHSAGGTSQWSAATDVGNQMRWTPSLSYGVGNYFDTLYLVYPDDGNTNISWRYDY